MITGLALLALAIAPADVASLSERAQPTVVKLVAEDARGQEESSGTGFFVSADGRIVTNHHVVEGASRLVALVQGGRRLAVVGVLARDEGSDLAVLQAEAGSYPFLTLGGDESLVVGTPVAVIGSPVGLEGTLSTGIVSAIRKNGTDIHGEQKASWQLQITAPISPGSSGSPVLLEDGRVVAVAVGKVLGGEGLNFAIPATLATALLARVAPGAKPEPLHASTALVRNLAISAVFFLVIAAGFRLGRRTGRGRDETRSTARH
ncbi:MAG: serine protease [Anaeromyxobacteraceae bacterium]